MYFQFLEIRACRCQNPGHGRCFTGLAQLLQNFQLGRQPLRSQITGTTLQGMGLAAGIRGIVVTQGHIHIAQRLAGMVKKGTHESLEITFEILAQFRQRLVVQYSDFRFRHVPANTLPASLKIEF